MSSLKPTAQSFSDWCAQQLHTLSPSSEQITLQPLRVEASHRSFYRVEDASTDSSWVAMTSPPELENNAQFVALAELFHGLGTPRLLAGDHDHGFFLMEDLGSDHLSDAYARMGGNQDALTAILDLALDTLQPWQQFTDAQIPPYTEDRLMMEFDLCAEWFAASLISLPPSMQDEITLAATRSTLILSLIHI